MGTQAACRAPLRDAGAPKGARGCASPRTIARWKQRCSHRLRVRDGVGCPACSPNSDPTVPPSTAPRASPPVGHTQGTPSHCPGIQLQEERGWEPTAGWKPTSVHGGWVAMEMAVLCSTAPAAARSPLFEQWGQPCPGAGGSHPGDTSTAASCPPCSPLPEGEMVSALPFCAPSSHSPTARCPCLPPQPGPRVLAGDRGHAAIKLLPSQNSQACHLLRVSLTISSISLETWQSPGDTVSPGVFAVNICAVMRDILSSRGHV